MKSKKATKRALLSSALSLVLCFSMLLGTTFAWFTDTASTGVNIIQSGTLKVDMVSGGKSVKDGTFDTLKFTQKVENGQPVAVDAKDILWEPGATFVSEGFQVVNLGNLWLKYQLAINGIDGDAELLEAIDIYITDAPDSRDAVELESYLGKLAPMGEENGRDKTKMYYLVASMKEEAGNEYQDKTLSNIAVTVFATQVEAEYDSFGNDYDKESAVHTIEEAERMMAEGKDVVLVNCIESDGILNVPVDYTGTLTLVSSGIKSVQAAGDVNIVILGDVVVNANGSGAATMALTESEKAAEAFDGSAITANGKLTISGNGKLTAIAADVNGAFGIGGMNATEINIEGITIDYVSGSYAYGVGDDTKYYKDAPEGGAAIGSGKDDAVINLKNVVVKEAIGGSKAAGIGARYHVGVTVNIADSTIRYVEGGVSAAGIGGSRVSGEASESGTTINISGSTVTAVGGAYGAGIGSGYDTHCLSEQPLCTINITDSAINATGGKYAAGVGTGYHNAALAGEIKNSTVKAVSGEKIYKDTYTPAMDIGFGVVDPTREGVQTNSKLVYNGKEITLASAPDIVGPGGLSDAIKNAADGATLVLMEGNYEMPTNVALNGKTLAISGTQGAVLDVSKVDERNQFVTGANLTFEGVTLNFGTKNYMGFANTASLTYKDCVINGLQFFYGSGTTSFVGCELNSNGAEHCAWTWGGQNISFTDCDFTYADRAVNCYGEGVTTNVSFTDCTFTKVAGKDTTGAIETNSSTLTALNLSIENCTVNEGNLWWVSTWDSKNGANTRVTVNGTVVTPVTNVEPAPYVGGCYKEGTNVVSYKDMVLGGDAYISIDNNAPVAIENVTADVNGSVIVMKDYQPAIYISGGNFTIGAGEYLIDASAIEGGVYQIFMVDVTVNGNLLTQETAGQYLNNVKWHQALQSN